MIRCFVALLAGVMCAASAAANDRYAVFVADMGSGEVLHARAADAPRHPASLTKMMTLYRIFEALEAGEVTLDTEMAVSAEAASRPASHLGLTEGETIRVEDAIRALIIQSANDVAVVVAEHFAENEADFASQITERAQQLGLTGTTFRNASGLHDREQLTTARDMARLAYALRRDFPDYAPYFAETRFEWHGTTHLSHNALVGNMDGVDGLKTGYIRASGFNIAVTVERDDRALIAVVMGGARPSVRDAHARELIEAAYASLAARDQGRLLATLNAPRLNPVREQILLTAELTDQLRPVAVGSAAAAPAVQVMFDDEPEASLPLPGDWAIQVGAYTSEAAARARLETVATLDIDARLANADPVAQPLQAGERRLWRARFAGLAADDARQACQRLEARAEPCFTVAPQNG
jgi:D-alanyl-D-alanine carboxypeptidase